MNTDKRFMGLALALAEKARGFTGPNPLVGAVIVRGGKVVGKGYHRRCGQPHAEVYAIKDAGPLAAGSVMYVTLEPCDHFGRTPPCTDAIIAAGIKKVFVAMKDPNPANNGRGIKKLTSHGIKTEVGPLGEEAAAINRPYIKLITKQIPYVTVKLASSLDGKIATRTGDSKWITSADSRRHVHRLRAAVDAVMIGANTAVRDDPMLLSKGSARQPIRIILDTDLKTPPSARIFSTCNISPVIVATSRHKKSRSTKGYEKKGVNFIFTKTTGSNINIKHLLKQLGFLGISSILVEGGGELVASLVKDRLADEFLFFIAPKIIGGRGAVPSVGGFGISRVDDALKLKFTKMRRIGSDILIEARS